MAFPWMNPDIPDEVKRSFRGKALEGLRTEVRQRATLLRHLGYTQQDAEARCRQNLRWDFEIGAGPCPIEGEVAGLVQQVYRR